MTEESVMLRLRGEIAAMSGELFDAIGMTYEEAGELERQVLSMFSFGMLFAVGQVNRLTPPEVHALTIANLIDAFRYTDQQAADFADILIASASNRTSNPAINAIIHRGIDGHEQWQAGERDGLRANIEQILQVLQTS